MRIYPKLLLITLPFIVAGALTVGWITSILAERAVFVSAEKWLHANLMDSVNMAVENYRVLEKYGLQGFAANVKKAQESTLRSLDEVVLGDSGFILTLNSQGLAYVFEGDTLVEHDVSNQRWWRQITAGELRKITLRWRGRRVLAVFQKVQPWDWYILACVPEDEVYGEIYGIKSYSIGVAVAVSVLSALLIMFLAKRMTTPLYTLVEHAHKIGRGDLHAPIPVRSKDEIGLLAKSFQEMQLHLQKMYSRLEKRINEREQAEEALANLNTQLESLVQKRTEDLAKKAEELEEVNRQLQEMDQMKSAFLSSVSHELRTPLTSVLGFAKLITRDFNRVYRPLGLDDKKIHRTGVRIAANLQIIEAEGERLTRLINDVLDLNKIESGKMEWRNQPLDLGEITRFAVNSLQGQLNNGEGARLAFDAPLGAPKIMADADRIFQVLVNLISNAIKFTPQGDVRVTVKPVGECMRVQVSDTGQGIAPAQLPHVFGKFVQGEDTLEDKPKGTGLGLAICAEIIEHYNGRIWAESTVGEGSTFTFELPVLK